MSLFQIPNDKHFPPYQCAGTYVSKMLQDENAAETIVRVIDLSIGLLHPNKTKKLTVDRFLELRNEKTRILKVDWDFLFDFTQKTYGADYVRTALASILRWQIATRPETWLMQETPNGPIYWMDPSYQGHPIVAKGRSKVMKKIREIQQYEQSYI